MVKIGDFGLARRMESETDNGVTCNEKNFQDYIGDNLIFHEVIFYLSANYIFLFLNTDVVMHNANNVRLRVMKKKIIRTNSRKNNQIS